MFKLRRANSEHVQLLATSRSSRETKDQVRLSGSNTRFGRLTCCSCVSQMLAERADRGHERLAGVPVPPSGSADVDPSSPATAEPRMWKFLCCAIRWRC